MAKDWRVYKIKGGDRRFIGSFANKEEADAYADKIADQYPDFDVEVEFTNTSESSEPSHWYFKKKN